MHVTPEHLEKPSPAKARMHATCRHCCCDFRAGLGESYHEAACRGLQEELGITAEVPTQPLGPMHRRSLVIPGQFTDNELVQSYRVNGFQGEVGPQFQLTQSSSLQAHAQMYSRVRLVIMTGQVAPT